MPIPQSIQFPADTLDRFLRAARDGDATMWNGPNVGLGFRFAPGRKVSPLLKVAWFFRSVNASGIGGGARSMEDWQPHSIGVHLGFVADAPKVAGIEAGVWILPDLVQQAYVVHTDLPADEVAELGTVYKDQLPLTIQPRVALRLGF